MVKFKAIEMRFKKKSYPYVHTSTVNMKWITYY